MLFVLFECTVGASTISNDVGSVGLHGICFAQGQKGPGVARSGFGICVMSNVFLALFR